MESSEATPKSEITNTEPIKVDVPVENPAPEDAAHELQKEMGLQPTAIVLAKVKGYRPWPAMVLDETILPENMRKMRPKSLKLSRKQRSPVIVVPVRFFSDDTYIWIKSCDLKILTREEIDAFLVKKANSRKDTHVEAYKLAQNPPDMGEFNKWGSRGPPEHGESADEAEDLEEEPETEEPAKKKVKLSLKFKNPTVSRAKTASKPKSKASPVPAQAPKTEAPVINQYTMDTFVPTKEPTYGFDDGYDSDWGLEEADVEGGNYIFDDEQEQQYFNETFPRASALSQAFRNAQDRFNELHRTLSPLLLIENTQSVENEAKIIAQLRALQTIIGKADTPIVAFTKSSLFRVLLLTLHKTHERFPHDTIRDAIKRVLASIDLEACRITEEDMVMPTTESTPVVNEGSDEKNGIEVA